MKVLDVALICSGSPGFLRSLGSLLAGRCRLMECYSIPEATQMIHLHSPAFSIFDVRSCSPQQLARTFVAISNINTGQAVLICVPNQLHKDRIPQESLQFCRIIELPNHDENYYELVEEILKPPANNAGLTVHDNDLDSPSAYDAAAKGSPATVDAMNRVGELKDTRSVGPVVPPGCELNGSSVDAGGMAEKFRTRTPELRTMLRRLEVAARHNVTILLIGETGSGKTHLASLIHEMSLRSNDPFLHVACGALPGELIESELFGHVKGSFTSAHADKEGKFLAAGNGTILLDEIDVLTPDQQVKLLRVIEKGEFEPVGSNRTILVKARIIAASNMQLQPLVEQGRFRPDLYYRLNTLSFTLPPLRKRMPDIEPLARYFVHRHASQLGIEVVEITPEFLECLLQYPWPGNVREMENAIRSAVIYSRDGKMTVDTLPTHVIDCISGPANDPSVAAFFAVRKGESLENRIEVTEKDIIEQALLNNNFSRTNTAKHLKISRVTLYNKMRKYGILPER
ncbi:MAG: sigma-54 dependent transcriptional regulator [Planctomycetaceae bacterium]